MEASPGDLYKNRYVFLFFALITLILFSPVFINLNSGKWLFNSVFYAISLLAIASLKHNNTKFFIALVLGGISIISSIINESYLTWYTELFRVIFVLLFLTFVSVAIFITLLKEREITQNLIFAALCAYLFIGLSFSQLYYLIELINPNSFNLAHTIDVVQRTFSFHFLYFSFTVLTTVGFGDVVPISAQAKSVVIVEEVTGVFYMAIFVSRLIAAERNYKKG